MPKKANHVLVYDKNDDSYYALTLEKLYADQNAKIEELRSNYEGKLSEIREEFEDYKETMTARFNELLESYKKVSENLIEMVTQEE